MSRPALQVLATLTHLGDTTTLTVLCVAVAIALLVLGRRRLAICWVVAVAGNDMLNLALKEVFARIRPLHVEGFGDVIAGFASGAAWLAVCITSIEFTQWHCQR